MRKKEILNANARGGILRMKNYCIELVATKRPFKKRTITIFARGEAYIQNR